MRAYVPGWLLAVGPRGIAMWQWLALPVLVALAWLMGVVLERLARAGLRLLLRRARPQADHAWIDVGFGPARWLWALAVAYALLVELRLPAPTEHVVEVILRTAAFAAFFWILLRLVS